jgi:DNA (cytosine-5)-methyltransferase 1
LIDVGSLFSGIGGIELGLERAGGYRTRWFVENEPYAVAVLKKRWPGTPVYGDITGLDFGKLPKVDMLTGGFPCQDISNAGKRAGIEGSRSGLWTYFREAIRQIRPRIALIENVSALITRGFDAVLADLASLGYDAEWHCFPASAVGAPHQRDRVFIFATRGDVADSNTKRLQRRQETRNIGSGRENREQQFGGQGADVADSECQFRDTRTRERIHTEQPKAKRQNISDGSCKNKRTQGWWAAEPELGRVAHGVPNRVDRIKCLGNAVVPQVAEAIGRAIQETMNGGRE